METKKRTNKKVQSKPPRLKDNPEIPDDILKAFLEANCNFSQLKNVSLVRGDFLWAKGSVERYRINVWQTTYELGEFCPNTRISHTWFVHFYRDELMIIDKTTGRVKEDKKTSKKLNGIANGTERIGKSFR